MPAAATEIARRSRGTPRVANRLLRRVRDYAQVRADGRITPRRHARALQMLEVDEHGFDELDRRLLLTIIEKFSGGPVGVGSLAAALSEERDAHRRHLRAVSHSGGVSRANAARSRGDGARLRVLRH